ncbi:hypothetical protein EYF80_060685 [Liparis tanakae]|uniref:Uncharacterized protein n=1 Tax=Liparis tanakae TaxID=230148 RepID=A0A4Z2EJX3_9TELE|nr:hypothetical protein EYF80_060685 [Liparis tanakae]
MVRSVICEVTVTLTFDLQPVHSGVQVDLWAKFEDVSRCPPFRRIGRTHNPKAQSRGLKGAGRLPPVLCLGPAPSPHARHPEAHHLLNSEFQSAARRNISILRKQSVRDEADTSGMSWTLCSESPDRRHTHTRDGDANETEHSGEDQASDTQPVVVCRERPEVTEVNTFK